VYILTVTLLGLALGPFTVGLVSDLSGELRIGLIAALIANLSAAGMLAIAARHLADDERTLIARARAAGEPGL
jgi:hypothetical protein